MKSTALPKDVNISPLYRADIDGLRAIAVGAVVLFHADNQLVSGGFVGVDIFFVISGYLITFILTRQMDAQKFSLFEFYERRIRRLLPSLITVLLACLIFGWAIFLPDEAKQLNTSVLATVGFVSNVFFWSQTGYFAPNANGLPLLHTWSLAVEEQFYIVFPLVLYYLRRSMGRLLGVAAIIASALAFIICLWGTFHRPAAAFYLAPFRAWELLLGAFLALNSRPVPENRFIREALSFVGLALIIFSLFFVSERTPFPGVGALPAVVGAAALIYSGSSGGTVAASMLSVRPLVALGLISYPLYLWHWPALVFARYLAGNQLGMLRLSVVLAACLALSVMTYWLIERPIRRKHVLKSQKTVFATAASMCAVIVTFNLAVIERDGFLWPVPSDVRTLVLANREKSNDWGYPEECRRNYKQPIGDPKDIVYCLIGGNSDRKVMFWGDSYVEQLFPAVAEAQLKGQFREQQIIFATSGGCLPTPGFERLEYGFHCHDFNEYVLRRALKSDVKYVVIGDAWDLFSQRAIVEQSITPERKSLIEIVEERMMAQLKQLAAGGKKIMLILSFPVFPQEIPAYLSRRLLAGQTAEVLLTRDMVLTRNGDINAMLRRVATAASAAVFDPSKLLCKNGPCMYEEQMLSLYKDDTHLTPRGSRRLLPMIQKIADEADRQPTAADEAGRR